MTPFKELVEVDSTAESTEPEPTQDEIAELAYTLWKERGCPIGSPEVDWQEAEEELVATRS